MKPSFRRSPSVASPNLRGRPSSHYRSGGSEASRPVPPKSSYIGVNSLDSTHLGT